MARSLRHSLGRIKGLLISNGKHAVRFAAYRGVFPPSWSDRIIKGFWTESAADIHERWGKGTRDYEVLAAVLKRYRPKSLLDCGCGSGRLFKLYEQCGVSDFVGTDISATALEIAQSAFPNAKLRQLRLEDLDYSHNSFDIAICNRTLQHIPERDIRAVIQKVTSACRLVYVNELTQSDGLHENFWMQMHDYPRLFEEFSFECLETGNVGKQTYYVFGRRETIESRTRAT